MTRSVLRDGNGSGQLRSTDASRCGRAEHVRKDSRESIRHGCESSDQARCCSFPHLRSSSMRKPPTHPCPSAPCSLSIAQQLAGSRPAMYGVRSSATLRPSPLELLGRPSSPSAGTADVLRRTVPSQRPTHYELSWSQQATRLDPCPPSLLCTLHAPTQPPTMTHLCWTPRSGQGCVLVRADERAPQDVVSVGISLERAVRAFLIRAQHELSHS